MFYCFARGFKIQDQIAAYNKGDHQLAIQIGKVIVERDLYNATAHYYLGNSYLSLGQTIEASVEYGNCIQTTRNPNLILYSRQALNLMNMGPPKVTEQNADEKQVKRLIQQASSPTK